MEDVLLVRNTHYGRYFYNEIEKTALFSQSFPNENLSMWDNVLFSCAQIDAVQKIISDETIVFRQKYNILNLSEYVIF